jgi:hypothetical protein
LEIPSARPEVSQTPEVTIRRPARFDRLGRPGEVEQSDVIGGRREEEVGRRGFMAGLGAGVASRIVNDAAEVVMVGSLRKYTASLVVVPVCAIVLVFLEPFDVVEAGRRSARLAFDDPMLTYSTTFGRVNGEVREIAVDGEGNIVIAGGTVGGNLFPLVNPADASSGDDGNEGFVAKISASGDELIYSTFLGGNGDDWIAGLAVDAAGNAYVSGTTTALDFPTVNAFQPLPHLDSSGFVRDAFVAKLDPDGVLLWSTYLGGEAGDEANDIAVDASGSVYVVGSTRSTDFPSANALQSACMLSPVIKRCDDAFVTKFAADGATLEFSTFLGGTGLEEACGVDVDGSGNVYVVGENRSADFPVLSPIQSERGGGTNDLFATKLAAAGNALIWSTHLGGSDEEGFCSVLARGPSVAVDSNGNAFLVSFVKSTDLPVAGGFQPTHHGGTDGYVAKVTSDGALGWSTYLGGAGSDIPTNVAIGSGGTPVIVGWTTSKDFPLTADALPESDCPNAATPFCPSDAFVAALSDGSLSYSTYLGGDDTEQASGVDVGPDDSIYVGGYTRTDLFPLVNPLASPYRGGGTVQQFASTIGSAESTIPGDANGDGAVTAGDALLTLAAAISTGSCALCVCDVNGDGVLTATDALVVLRLAVGLPVETNAPPC